MPKIPRDPWYKLYNEDCFETFKRIKDHSIDLILVDPPYGTTACKWDSIIPLEPMWKEVWRVVKNDTAVVIFGAQPFSSLLVCSCLQNFKYELIFEKTRAIGFLYAKKRPLACHENVQIFSKGWTKYNPVKTEGIPYSRGKCKEMDVPSLKNGRLVKSHTRKPNKTGERLPRSVLTFKNADSEGKSKHPTQKPISLIEYLIKTYSNAQDLVLDFAMGSGTTGVACGNLGRNFIGCDNDTEHGYFQIAQERISQAYHA